MDESKKMSIFTAVIVAIAIASGFIAYKITNVPDSNTEQVAEQIIKHETGLNVDFSPAEN